MGEQELRYGCCCGAYIEIPASMPQVLYQTFMSRHSDCLRIWKDRNEVPFRD